MNGATNDKRSLRSFEQLAFQQMDGLSNLAYHLTRNAADAEDLVQETYLRAYRHFEQFQAGTNFRAWIFRILRNAAINQFRRDRVRGASIDLESVRHRLEGPRHGTARQGAMTFTATDIRTALDRLSEEYRTAVLLSFIEGFSYREIADIMGCPIGTVMSRISRARRQLRSDLLGMLPPPGRKAAA